MNFAAYDATGWIAQVLTCSSTDQFDGWASPGLALASCPEGANALTHWVSGGVVTPYSDAAVAALAVNPGPGYSWVPASGAWKDSRSLADAQMQNQARLVTARDALEYAPVTVNAMTFAADMQSQARIAGAVQMALLAQLGSQPFSIDWTLADGVTHVTLDGPGMIAVGQAVAAAVEAAFARWRTAQAAVAAATINSQADAVGL